MDCIVVYGFTGFIVEWFKSLDSGVSGPIYVNVDSPNLGFPYFNFFMGVPVKKNTLYDEGGVLRCFV